ncbi:hypothetical protein ABGB17_07000 [Sphaerisporangium sp. B11E5]|uniref:hypothetical protein n=1 Tax=Sphaerisporangium sp. B11E5 TaxID=3153563 RepID=UPI00325D1533
MREAGQAEGELGLLKERIRRLYCVEAGQPSYNAFERVAESVIREREDKEFLRLLPRATACDLVRGKFKKPPDWVLIRTFVVVCHHIATKSDLQIAPLEDLHKEFSVLWQAAKAAEGGVTPPRHGAEQALPDRGGGDPATEVAGDLLAPVPGERPPVRRSRVMRRVPEGWGARRRLRLDDAEGGDAGAAYEMAVLLACEALTAREPEDVKYWRDMAAYWQGRAIGKVAEAAELRLRGQKLVKAAYALAFRYKRAEDPYSGDFFLAATQADASVEGSRIAPATDDLSGDLVSSGD